MSLKNLLVISIRIFVVNNPLIQVCNVVLGLSDSENNTITIVKIVIVNTITIVGY